MSCGPDDGSAVISVFGFDFYIDSKDLCYRVSLQNPLLLLVQIYSVTPSTWRSRRSRRTKMEMPSLTR